MLGSLRPGDQLVVAKLDRLARSLVELLTIAADLEARGIDLVVLDQAIDTSTPAGRLMFQVLGAVSQFERELAIERTRASVAHRRATGAIWVAGAAAIPPRRSSWATAYGTRGSRSARSARPWG